MIQQTLSKSLFEKTGRSLSLENLTNKQTSQSIDAETWQSDHVPTPKRKRSEMSPDINISGNKFSKVNYAVPTQNRLKILEVNEDKPPTLEQPRPPKPEPIFVTGVINVTSLKDVLNKLGKTNMYRYYDYPEIRTYRQNHAY